MSDLMLDDYPDTEPEAPTGELSARIWDALYEAREIAFGHRHQLIARGLDEESANHVTSGALYEIQDQLLAQVRES